jgi:cell wall-associated NlpC family hydrolase
LDPRLNPYRTDLAAAHLRGKVDAPRFVDGVPAQVVDPSAPIHAAPRFDAEMTSEALRGETVKVYDDHEGWAWAQLDGDGYVGYMPSAALGPKIIQATCRIIVPRTFLFTEPDIKSLPAAALSLGCTVACAPHDDRFLAVDGGGFLFARHAASVDHIANDWVAVAEWFLSTPYLWGGKQHTGLDCSGLVQAAAQAGGIDAPRDTDMQRDRFGTPLDVAGRATLRRGDLVFWNGHVGIMRDADNLLHANAHHMMCVSEPLAGAVARIARGSGDIVQINRIS